MAIPRTSLPAVVPPGPATSGPRQTIVQSIHPRDISHRVFHYGANRLSTPSPASKSREHLTRTFNDRTILYAFFPNEIEQRMCSRIRESVGKISAHQSRATSSHAHETFESKSTMADDKYSARSWPSFVYSAYDRNKIATTCKFDSVRSFPMGRQNMDEE